MRSKYENELSQIQDCFSRLSNKVLNVLEDSMECLLSWDKEKSQLIIEEDLKINNLQRELEQRCFGLIMKQQPVAGDYRFLSALVKFSGDYERIGDQSKDICEIIISSESALDENLLILLHKMYDEVKYMLDGATESIKAQDEALGTEVSTHDDLVDELYREVRDYCIEAIKVNNLREFAIIDGLQIGKYLERIGDHSENIAKWSSYIKSGVYPM